MAELHGLDTIQFGCDSSRTYGLIQSQNTGKGAKTKELLDHEGEVAALAVSDQHATFSLTAILLADGNGNVDLPEIGEQITFKGKTYRCNQCDVAWSNEDGAKVTLGGRTYKFDSAQNTAQT